MNPNNTKTLNPSCLFLYNTLIPSNLKKNVKTTVLISIDAKIEYKQEYFLQISFLKQTNIE